MCSLAGIDAPCFSVSDGRNAASHWMRVEAAQAKGRRCSNPKLAIIWTSANFFGCLMLHATRLLGKRSAMSTSMSMMIGVPQVRTSGEIEGRKAVRPSADRH